MLRNLVSRVRYSLENTYFDLVDSLAKAISSIGRGPLWRAEAFAWLPLVEQQTPAIWREVQTFLASGQHMLDKEDLDPGNTGHFGKERWELLHLKVFGRDMGDIQTQFPDTMRALQAVPGVCSIMFSRLPPERKDIPTHCDAKNGTLRMHLGLKIPKSGACFIRIGDQTAHWQDGQAFVLDVTAPHSVCKEAPEERVILMVDFLRPMPKWLSFLTYTQFEKRRGIWAQRRIQKHYEKTGKLA